MKKLIIIGSGISGLSSAYYLKNKFKIIILEKNNYIGGHTHTHYFKKENVNYDSGFIVFNNKNYPNFINLINKLGVKYQKSSMSFSVRHDRKGYEWAGKNLKTIFSIKNIFTIRYFKILRDIILFSKLCENYNYKKKISLKSFIRTNKLSNEFADLYLYPMCSSIWSSNIKNIKNADTSFVLNFFKNHGLNNIITKRPTWFTIKNGSHSYIKKIIQSRNIKIKLNNQAIEVDQIKKKVKTINGNILKYDHLIFANHSSEAIKILKKPSKDQIKLIRSVKYQKNNVIIHSDEKLMPNEKGNWCSWNYLYHNNKIVLTYWMNLLQNLKCKTNIFVTLNNTKIRKEKLIKKITYSHPLFTKSLEEVNILLEKAQGINNVWFAGAWLGYGFHEDGVKSAIKIRDMINV